MIEIKQAPGGEYRLFCQSSPIGQESYDGFDVLCLGDEVLEQEGYQRDSVGFVFASRLEATIAMRLVISAVQRYRREAA